MKKYTTLILLILFTNSLLNAEFNLFELSEGMEIQSLNDEEVTTPNNIYEKKVCHKSMPQL